MELQLIALGTVALITAAAIGLFIRNYVASDDQSDPLDEFAVDDSEDESTIDLEPVADRVGRIVAMTVIVPGGLLKRTVKVFAVTVWNRVPFVGASFWKGMLKTATRQYQKATGADAVAFSAEPTGMEPTAVNWYEPDPDDVEDKPGWKEVGGEKTWGSGAEGKDVERMGKADVIIADRSAHESAAPLQLRFAEALDLEQVDPLIAGADVHQNLIEMWPEDPDASSMGDAVADGGSEVVERKVGETQVHARNAGLADSVVDLSSDFGDGKGMRVSARKYGEAYQETTTTEEMNNQETRGYLAGKSAQDNKAELIKAIIIIGAIFILYETGPVIVRTLFGSGGGGGGGGGLMPLMLNAGDLVTTALPLIGV